MCRHYSSKVPKVDDIVMCQIGTKHDLGYSVVLLEYNSISGFLPDTHIYNRQKNVRKKTVKEGDIIPLSVTSIVNTLDESGPGTGFVTIDLSKRKISIEEEEIAKQQYKFSRNLTRIGQEVFYLYNSYRKQELAEAIKDLTLEDIMENTIWFLYKVNEKDKGYLETIYNSILAKPETMLPATYFPSSFIEYASNNMLQRLATKNMVLESELSVLIYSSEGVNAIKEILDVARITNAIFETHGLNKNYDGLKLAITTNASPIYKVSLICNNKVNGQKFIQLVTDQIKLDTEIRKGGTFRITQECALTKEPELEFKFLTEYDIEKMQQRS